MRIELIDSIGRNNVVQVRLRFDHDHKSNTHGFTIDKFDMDRSIKAGKKGVKLKLKSGEIVDYSFTCTTPEEYIAGWTKFCIADANQMRIDNEILDDFTAEECDTSDLVRHCKACFRDDNRKHIQIAQNRVRELCVKTGRVIREEISR